MPGSASPGMPDQPLAARMAQAAARRPPRPGRGRGDGGRRPHRAAGRGRPEDLALVARLEEVAGDPPRRPRRPPAARRSLAGARALARGAGGPGAGRRAPRRRRPAAQDLVDLAEIMHPRGGRLRLARGGGGAGAGAGARPREPGGALLLGPDAAAGRPPDLAARSGRGLARRGAARRALDRARPRPGSRRRRGSPACRLRPSPPPGPDAADIEAAARPAAGRAAGDDRGHGRPARASALRPRAARPRTGRG